MQKQVEAQNNFPIWVRIFTLFMATILIGIGSKRYFLPVEARDPETYTTYLIIGSVCLIVLGYSRRLFVSEVGLVRVTNIWGRKTTEVLMTWNEVERIIYSEKRDAFVACFERGNVGYRMFVDLKDKDSLCELIKIYTKNWH